MACPRCGGGLEALTMGAAEAIVCESCGYVDVPADHHGEFESSEPWSEALRRFYARQRGDGAIGAVSDDLEQIPDELAEKYADLTEKQRLIVDELLDEDDPTDPDRTHRSIAESVGVGPSYAGEVIRRFGDLAAAIRRERPEPPD